MTRLKVLEVAEEIGMERVARIALKKEMPLESIQELTGLSRERIAALSTVDSVEKGSK
ncbi:MAG: hypothetical protein LBB48_03170 [Treponema sp.]|jgi:hypothetical protein|nr:hypothetical protein [Treponema sp.]